MDPFVYHFATDNLPPLNIQRNEYKYPSNGWKNVYAAQPSNEDSEDSEDSEEET